MTVRKRPHTYSATTARTQAVTPSPQKLDIWLQRISLISQLGLFLFTVGTIYFTVIPLYQKALLDEQIAQKQIELEQLHIDLDTTYAKVQFGILKDFTMHAAAACSGLLLPFPPLPTLQSGPFKDSQDHSGDVLSIKPVDCLNQELRDDAELRELKPHDLLFLKGKLSDLGVALEDSRQRALARFARANETAATKPVRIPTDGLAGVFVQFALKDQPPEFRQQFSVMYAIEQERSSAANDYATEVQSKLIALRQVKWPVDTSTPP
jgi:hypothetical protein